MAFPSVEIIARKAGAVWGELPRRAWDEKTGESQDLARAGASIVATRPGFLFANSWRAPSVTGVLEAAERQRRRREPIQLRAQASQTAPRLFQGPVEWRPEEFLRSTSAMTWAPSKTITAIASILISATTDVAKEP